VRKALKVLKDGCGLRDPETVKDFIYEMEVARAVQGSTYKTANSSVAHRFLGIISVFSGIMNGSIIEVKASVYHDST
jgi:hypothetical protein